MHENFDSQGIWNLVQSLREQMRQVQTTVQLESFINDLDHPLCKIWLELISSNIRQHLDFHLRCKAVVTVVGTKPVSKYT